MENNRKSSQEDTEKYNLEILLRRPSLRASIPRRVSQVRRETTTPDTTCGMGCIKGEWLQSFANRTSFIFVYEVLGNFYASYIAYFYGTISTLEKRFKFSNQAIGIIAASGDISKILTCLLLSVLSFNVHKPRCLGVAVSFIILSTLIFTIPHFLYDSGHKLSGWHGNATQSKDGNCSDSYLMCSNETNESAYSIFLLTQVLRGIGGGLYQTQGKSYKDENIHLRQSPSLISLLAILKILGPAFGYWLSSVCLKIYLSFEKPTRDNETDGTGTWWLGNLVIAFILFVVGFLLVLFPPTLPKAVIRRNFNIKGRAEDKQNSTNGGTITLISAAFGIVMASSVITRYRPKARALASWTMIVGVLSIGGLLFYTYLGCTENDSQIKKIASQYSRPENSCECGFHLICTESDNSVPPCLTKCGVSYENSTKVHKNCNTTLIKDFCPVDCYSSFLLFIIVSCSITFVYALGQASNFWLEIKWPDSKFHPLHFINILASITAPIIFGYILDKSCLLWDENCTGKGNCLLYDNENLRYMINFTAIGFAVIDITYNMGVWYLIRNVTLFHDDENDDEDVRNEPDDEYTRQNNEI